MLPSAMGAVVTAPLYAVGSCLGSCVATSCCKLTCSGSVRTVRAERMVLLWFQVFTTVLTLIVSLTPSKWLPNVCDWKIFSAHVGGVCACEASEDLTKERCWSDQLVYRIEAAAAVILLLHLLLSVSGCAKVAARSFIVGKFVLLPLLAFGFFFVPNGVANVFGSIATVVSAIFLIAQAILLIDAAYVWNEVWHSKVLSSTASGPNGGRAWIVAILVASAVFILGGIGCSIAICVTFKSATVTWVTTTALVISLVLLIVSITEWCEHGALLTSGVVMGYITWLCFSAANDFSEKEMNAWLALVICAVSLAAFAHAGMKKSRSVRLADQESGVTEPESDAGAGADTKHSSDAEAADEPVSARAFALQCLVHLMAAMYVTNALAPVTGHLSFGLVTAALYITLALYGWSLVAPKVLKNRDFS